MQAEKVIVIGSGFGGLAVAARLAARGYQVEVLEKLDKAGGRAYVFERQGFIFDGGPTVITAPFLFDEIFELAGRKREDYVEFIPLNPFYRIFDHQGRYFEYNADIDYVQSQIDQWHPADRAGYKRFLDTTQAIFQKGFIELADKPFLSFTDMLKVAPDLIKLRSYRSVYGYVSQFIENEFLRRCFTFHPLLIGGNPFTASSIYTLIHYLEREWGVWYARGGTGALVQALVRLIEELGGRFYFNAEVDKILIENKRAVGVRLKEGSVHKADHVISNVDVPFTYMHLIDPQHRGLRNSDLRYRRLTRYSMSLVVIYFGTDRLYRDTPLAHHNIIFGKRYKGLLEDIFEGQTLPEDFSLYLHMPTLTDPSLAPPGHEAFYVLAPVPHLGANIHWEQAAQTYQTAILRFLEENYLPDLQHHIVSIHMIDPRYFRDCLNTYLGTGFSIQPLLTQSAWFRPHNRSEDIPNLYFVGAGTHPGAGLPGVVSSAKIVDHLISGASHSQHQTFGEKSW
jgi:phytoene desaturase